MASRSSNSRRQKAEQDCPTNPCRSSVAASPTSNTQKQKRWLPRQRRSANTAQHAPETVELSGYDRDILLRQQALMEAQRGNYDEAIIMLNQLIRRHPESATDYNNRGLVYFQSGLSEAALNDYNHALEINPRLDSAYNNRANYYAAMGNLTAAIQDYDTAIDLNPSNIRAWINQGITFRDLQMYEQAIECFDLALCIGRLEGHIYAERGRTYHLWGDWNCAVADYHRAIEILPGTSNTSPDQSTRLCLQVNTWLNELLCPIEF